MGSALMKIKTWLCTSNPDKAAIMEDHPDD
jgi:hypothetical protein